MGDWIVGHRGINEGYKLIYAMEVTEIMCFDDYYNDSRFNYKKPVIGGKWWQISGDNIYYRDDNGNYTFDINPLHMDKYETDIKNPKVFISNNFYYFGENAIEEFPQLFPFLVNNVRRFTYEENENKIITFITWLKKKYKRGRNGNRPADPVREPGC